MCKDKEFTIFNTFKALLSLILSGFLLVTTLPSLKFMMLNRGTLFKQVNSLYLQLITLKRSNYHFKQ